MPRESKQNPLQTNNENKQGAKVWHYYKIKYNSIVVVKQIPTNRLSKTPSFKFYPVAPLLMN